MKKPLSEKQGIINYDENKKPIYAVKSKDVAEAVSNCIKRLRKVGSDGGEGFKIIGVENAIYELKEEFGSFNQSPQTKPTISESKTSDNWDKTADTQICANCGHVEGLHTLLGHGECVGGSDEKWVNGCPCKKFQPERSGE